MKTLLPFVGASMIVLATSGCGTAEAKCDCAAPGVVLDVPAALIPQVTSVTVSDRACNGVTAQCSLKDGAGLCAQYTVLPTAIGNCHVAVALSGRTFSSDVLIVQATGCCSGLYPSPLVAGHLEVTRSAWEGASP
jgi:hypothetical protein